MSDSVDISAGNKRPAPSPEHAAQPGDGDGSAAAAQQQPDVKRVRLDDDVTLPAAAADTSEGAAAAPSASQDAAQKDNAVADRERDRNDSRTGQGRDQGRDRRRGGGGGGRGRRGGDYKGNKGQGKPDKKAWKNSGSRDDDDDDGEGGQGQGQGQGSGLNADGTPKLPKKKVALLIGYSGLGYNGSQINPGVPTIEQEVFDACVKAGAISADNSDNVNKVSLMRAARTDAGVSAAINVLNLKLILNPPSLPEGTSLTAHINSFLPPAVQIWNIIRVQGGFHSRTMCDSRMYNYSLPTYCFLEPRPETAMGKRVTLQEGEHNWWDDKPASTAKSKDRAAGKEGERAGERAEGEDIEGSSGVKKEEQVPPKVKQEDAEEPIKEGDESASATAGEAVTAPVAGERAMTEAEDADSSAPPAHPTMSAFKEDQILRKGYRISPETLARLRHTINAYKGSHNFWNFTVGKDFKDRSCQRVMKNLTVTDPFMVGDSEWVSLKFHGQSFMLHQIRKMTGLLIMAVRTRTPASLIPETFGPTRLNIPKAPALGLLLEQPQFESYNRKIGAQVGQAEVFASRKGEGESGSAGVEAEAEGGDYPVREQVEYSGIDEAVEKFKREVVFLAMHTEEEKDDTYAKWLNLHDSQLGDDFDYLNAKGVIPPTLGKKKPERAPKNTDGAESSRAGVVPKTEEDDDEEARLARANKGKASADMEG